MKKWLPFLLLPSLLMAGGDLQSKIRQARQKVFPALVHIQPIKEFVDSGEPQKVQVTGSGFIFSEDGYVLTNNHVAEKARFVMCTLSSKKEVEAEVVGLDPWTDLAVLKLKLEKSNLKKVPFARLGDSDQLEVGQVVLALGSPLGLARSLSMGVISSVDRYFGQSGDMTSPYNLWIQTDAAINPGNSGGPLVNLDGEVVGINARAITFGENLGFAIPINTAKYVIKQLLEKGEVERAWIGVEWQEIKDLKAYLNLPKLQGVLIREIDENSPAQKAGLRPGFVVTEINGQKVNALYQEELPKVRLLVSSLPVGQSIEIKFLDENLAPQKVTLITEKQGKFSGDEYYCAEWGFSVKEITPRIRKHFRLTESDKVLISGIQMGSPAQEAGVFSGAVLKKIDNQPVKNIDQFITAYENQYRKDNKDHLLLIKIGEVNRFALIKGKKQE
ncbi:MAG: trypsin-like peptidase domain-containing protein [Caldisericaceae bacterium]|nr:trypsin-like peptidase domain-containing protein [Caldisericaceae bacterium]